MPEGGYHEDIINIGKDLAEKQPELKDLSEDERIKTFRN